MDREEDWPLSCRQRFRRNNADQVVAENPNNQQSASNALQRLDHATRHWLTLVAELEGMEEEQIGAAVREQLGKKLIAAECVMEQLAKKYSG